MLLFDFDTPANHFFYNREKTYPVGLGVFFQKKHLFPAVFVQHFLSPSQTKQQRITARRKHEV